jgi:methylenetetrahydrofolate reductase (NADPH)
LRRFLKGYSIEVMPRTAEKVESFRDILPGHPRLHRPYRRHPDRGHGGDGQARAPRRLYRDAALSRAHHQGQGHAGRLGRPLQGRGRVKQGLLLAAASRSRSGDFHTSMQLLETGPFDGFERLHVAGHPEGNKDIDPDGSDRMVMEAAALEIRPSWNGPTPDGPGHAVLLRGRAGDRLGHRLQAEGIKLPVHIGVAGPAKLQTLIKFAIACGVGPSLRVLQKRAMDVTKLLLPYEPTEILTDLPPTRPPIPGFGIEQVHFFPLGGIKTNAQWVTDNGGASGRPAAQS